jgi:hypothetical protein
MIRAATILAVLALLALAAARCSILQSSAIDHASSEYDAGDASATRDGAPGDAGNALACNPPSQGAPLLPGHISCGSTECTLNQQVCCLAVPPKSAGCQAPSADRSTCQSVLACDKDTDCPPGQQCWATYDQGTGFFTSACSSTTGDVRLCRCTSECPECKVYSCNLFSLESCGTPPSPTCF